MIPSGYKIDAVNGIVYGRKGKPLVGLSAGYVRIYSAADKLSIRAHCVIWESVQGPIPKGMHVNHINGNKLDNRISNLELVTQAGNNRHARVIGLVKNYGSKHVNAKLTESAVKEIIESPERTTHIAKRLGVSHSLISMVRSGKLWTHITNPERFKDVYGDVPTA